MTRVDDLKAELRKVGTPEKAAHSLRFFKGGPGQYGEGDKFIGVTVPGQRKVAKQFKDLSLEDIELLLQSDIHEERLTALLILVSQYKKGDQEAIYDLFVRNARRVNNWDLVDSSAPYIMGPYLAERDKSILVKLAKSDSLWERRIAMMATFYYIKQGDPAEALKIATVLLHDPHDLIHKAVGWMLREIGEKCGQEIEAEFLLKHYKTMPRTMLRYAIEKFPPQQREQYMKGLV